MIDTTTRRSMTRAPTTLGANRQPAVRLVAFVAVGLLTALGACDAGSDADSEAAPEASGPAADAGMDPAAASGPAGLNALDPWVRVAIRPEGSDEPDAPPVNSAAYFVVRNPGSAADAIIGVETEVADTAELHTVSMDGGVMRMRPVDSVAVAAGEDVVLEPGGYHVMLIGIRRALDEGDTIPLTLRFRGGDSVAVMAPVLRAPPQM